MTLNITKTNLLHGVYLLLLFTIVGLLLWMQPWQTSTTEVRKITVSGEATVQSEPDEYIFNPYFEVKGDDQESAKQEISTLANDAVDSLKELGVEEKDIKLDASSYDRWYWQEDEEGVLTAYIQISVNDKELAQKVQDFLTASEAKGQLTSSEKFSEGKQKSLESEATEKAIDDARTKAEEQAKLLGMSVGDVIEVKQNEGFNAIPFAEDALEVSTRDASTSIPVLPGEQEYTKTIEVTFELK